MATAEEVPDRVLESLPENVTRGQIKQAWKARELIWRLTSEGKNPYQISPNIHTPVRVIEHVVKFRPEPEGSADQEKPGPEAAQPEPAEPPETASPPIPFGAQYGAGPPPPKAAGQSAAPPSAPAAQPSAGVEASRPQFMGGPDLGQVGEPIPGPRFGEKFEVQDVYQALYNLCIAYGIPPVQAGGIVWQFQVQYDPEDAAALRKLLTVAGKNKILTEQVVGGWQAIMRRMGAEESRPGPDTDVDTRLRALRRRAGLETGENADDPRLRALEDLEKEEKALDIEKTRLEIEEKRRQVREGGGRTTLSLDDEMQDVMLDINGVPTLKRIRSSQLGLYQPFLSQPRQAGPGQSEEAPPWAKAILEEQAVARREREVETRRNEIAEAVRVATAPLEERLKQFTPNTQGARTDEEIRQLREIIASKDREADNMRFQRLEDLVRQGMSVESAQATIARERARASAVGMVPASTAGDLREDQIHLRAEADSLTNRNNAQARAVDIVAKKVEKEPLATLAREARLPQLLGETVRQNLQQESPDLQGRLMTQSDEHMAAALAQLEGQAAHPPQPARPPLPGTGAGDESSGIVSR